MLLEEGGTMNHLVMVRSAMLSLIEKHPVFEHGVFVCSSAFVATAAGVVVVGGIEKSSGWRRGGDGGGVGVPVRGGKSVAQGEGEVEIGSRRGGEVGDWVGGQADLGGK